jgi:MFS superfamily sulfate permease-like transporter
MTYYIPFFAWIKQYKWAYLQGDLIAAITMASFYIPMALSLASNLAHIPPINGLYSFVFNPLIYAFLGSCPQMVVGPEAAGSLLVGSVVRSSLDKGNTGDEDSIIEAQIAGLVTGMAGAVIFIAGITRLGFLENVLSRPFMRGFISSVGFIIMIDQLIVEMGLLKIAGQVGGITHGSSVAKLGFLFTHFREAHKLTCAVAGISFLIIMTFR